MENKTLFVGSGVAIVTPFKNGGIDFEAFEKLIKFQLENNTDSIIVAGTTGESATMSDSEQLSAIEFVVKKVAGKVPVIAGTGSNNTVHCIHMSQAAEKLGVDGLLVVTPYYNKTSPHGLVRHFMDVADSVNIPIIVYNVPSRTGMNVSAEALCEMSKHQNIVAIKEASGDLSLATKMMKLCGGTVDLYSGNDDVVLPLLAIGGKGVISVAANVVPQQMHDLVAKFVGGDIEGSREIQLDLINLIDALFVETNPIPVKTALNLMGYDVGELRPPLYDMSEKNFAILSNAMKDSGLI